MKRTDFTYDLPPDLIAQEPLAERSAARMLVVDADELHDSRVRDLPELIRPGDLLILNDTRVMRARLRGRRPSGGKVEVVIERMESDVRAKAFVRASKSLKEGAVIEFASTRAEVVGRDEGLFLLELHGGSWPALMEHEGEVPLPPYIERAPTAEDLERYQTVFAREQGAVAAPTAGLHLDEHLLERLQASGAELGYVTLHVGAGTFQPVRADDLADHVMHAEQIEVSEAVVDQVRRARERGGRVIAIGTTVVRALESAAHNGELAPFHGDSRLFITPGYRFRVVDALLTNFHLPESTLLMLVSAFAGIERIRAAYAHAVRVRYRFFSYGDAMWLTRAEPNA